MNVPKRKLLLADDSITIQKVVNLTFAEEGIDVTAVGDGDAALEYLARETPDLVMVDVNMPGANGYQICEAIRSYEVTREMPVVLLVGSFEPFDEAEAERVGASAFMTKPFQSIRQLVATITEMMDAAAPVTTTENVPLAEQDTAELPQEIAAENALEQTAPATVEYREDIDSLYNSSVTTDATTDFAFAGDELDDEMIETSYSDNDSSVVDYELPDISTTDHSDSESAVDIEMSQYYVESPAVAETVKLSADDLPSFGNADITETNDVAISDNSGSLNTEATHEIREEPVSDPFEFTPLPTDDAVTPAEPPIVSTENFDRSLHLVEPPVAQTQPLEPLQEQASVSFAAPASPIEQFPVQRPDPFESKAAESVVDTSVASTIVDLPPASFFEEVNLLDLPPAGNSSTIEFTTPVLASDAGSNKQVVSVSPELMEVIVQKVLERLQQR